MLCDAIRLCSICNHQEGLSLPVQYVVQGGTVPGLLDMVLGSRGTVPTHLMCNTRRDCPWLT